jgi:hypothetical protein
MRAVASREPALWAIGLDKSTTLTTSQFKKCF